MQATKTRAELGYFDRFECLSCLTVISAATQRPKRRPPRDGDE